jgi:hypothetical protein
MIFKEGFPTNHTEEEFPTNHTNHTNHREEFPTNHTNHSNNEIYYLCGSCG